MNNNYLLISQMPRFKHCSIFSIFKLSIFLFLLSIFLFLFLIFDFCIFGFLHFCIFPSAVPFPENREQGNLEKFLWNMYEGRKFDISNKNPNTASFTKPTRNPIIKWALLKTFVSLCKNPDILNFLGSHLWTNNQTIVHKIIP